MKAARLITLALGTLLVSRAMPQTPTAITYADVAALDELNTVGNADAYPWISADGLRLYFTQDDASVEKLKLATRASTSEPFGASALLLPNEAIEQVSCWLSADELTMWFTSSSGVRKAVRASMASPFGASVPVTLSGFSGTVKSPTLTPDEEQMIIYSSGNFIFDRTGTDTYVQVGPLTTGTSGTGPMKMSDDGLTLWFGADYNGVRTPHRMTRATTADAFTNLEYFAGSEFDPAYGWFHPHLTPDGGILVGTRGSNGLWTGNDLFGAIGETGTAVDDLGASWVDAPLAYPNPACDLLNIRLPDGWRSAELLLLDARGRVCVQERINGTSAIAVDDLPAGIYALQFTDEQRLAVRVVIER